MKKTSEYRGGSAPWAASCFGGADAHEAVATTTKRPM
jgi:hypothetical protein